MIFLREARSSEPASGLILSDIPRGPKDLGDGLIPCYVRAMDFATGKVEFERTHQSERGSYEIILTEQWDLRMTLRGVGTVDSFRHLIDTLEEIYQTYPNTPKIRAGVDLTGGENAPLRAQMMLGKWLLSRRHRVGKLAVFGGPPLPMKIARAVCSIAGMKEAAFFRTCEDGLRYLNGG